MNAAEVVATCALLPHWQRNVMRGIDKRRRQRQRNNSQQHFCPAEHLPFPMLLPHREQELCQQHFCLSP
jgi:hypothetical protein